MPIAIREMWGPGSKLNHGTAGCSPCIALPGQPILGTLGTMFDSHVAKWVFQKKNESLEHGLNRVLFRDSFWCFKSHGDETTWILKDGLLLLAHFKASGPDCQDSIQQVLGSHSATVKYGQLVLLWAFFEVRSLQLIECG